MDKLIEKIDLTNELLYRLCLGQRLLSFKECREIGSLIPRMTDHPCTPCRPHCVEQEEKLT